MVDTTFLLDVVFVLIACICAGFLVFGAWLCLGNRTTAGSQETRDQPQIPGRSPPKGSFL